MAPKKEMSMRTKIGWITIALFLGIAYGMYRYITFRDATFLEFNRPGILMLILWIAWPELETLPRWMFLTLPVVTLVAAFRPQILIVVLPLTLLYLFLRPKPQKKSESKDKK